MCEGSNERASAWTRMPMQRLLLAVGLIAMGGMFQSASAATLCVNPRGTRGCSSTIQAAITMANPGDTIRVAPGVYREDVMIDKSISLIGANASNTIIDAAGKGNGINVDGFDSSGLNEIGVADVVITGFTVKNAKYEGIVVSNATNVTIWGNAISNNNRSLDAKKLTCKGIFDWELAEGFDCGEGIHFSGVDHSTVANNVIVNNAGGILLSDDTGATHDNVITGNTVRNNPYDCGITLASHPNIETFTPSQVAPFGVFHNTISDNLSAHNGLAEEGAGAGVGIFDSIPGAKDFGNVVIHNRLIGNGLPGVTMHSHAPGQDLTDNAIVGNYIAGNGADTEDAETPGPTGINVFGVSAASGTLISQNIIKDEVIGIAVSTPAQVNAHLNDLLVSEFGVDNLGSTGMVDATQNWWGCVMGPSGAGCSSVDGTNVTAWPYLMHPFHSEK